MQVTPIEVRVDHDGPRTTVRVRGELDLSATRSLSDALQTDTATCTHVVIDLSGVTFLDSSGIAALVRTRAFHQAAGRPCEVVGAQGQPARVLEIAGLDHMEKLVERHL